MHDGPTTVTEDRPVVSAAPQSAPQHNATPLLDQILTGRVSDTMRFDEKVWTLTSRVPPGWVTTYRDIAEALNTRAYRAVGLALKRNPHAPTVPCHRVVASNGHLNGYARGLERKATLLAEEGIEVRNNRVSLTRHHWRFESTEPRP